MKLDTHKAILPSSYFPPVTHIVAMNHLNFKIELNENYQKRSVRNRCRVLAANGPIYLSVPLQKGRTKQLMHNVRISYAEDWMTNHCRSIKSAYGTSPYFDFYYDSICDIIQTKQELLHDLNHQVYLFLERIGLIPGISYTSEFIPAGEFDGYDFRSGNSEQAITIPGYEQVFAFKFGFVQNLSILDLLFNLGPESIQLIRDSKMDI